MSPFSLFFFFFSSLFSLFPAFLSQPLLSYRIDCGATKPTDFNGYQWLPDSSYVYAGTSKNVTFPGVLPILSTVRSFASKGNRGKKFCYEMGVIRFGRYLVRTTYFYGGVNGKRPPPVFDQIVDGTLWSVVNTTYDYAQNLSSYYEGVFLATGKTMSVCLGVNKYTDSDPFISALELIILENSVYNSTNFWKFGLSLVARNNFGYNGPIIRSPDDQFDRLWQPFGSYSPVSEAPNVSISGFWNLPPAKIFDTQLTVDKGTLEIHWPRGPLVNSLYYIALYFADDRVSLSGSRVFSIHINGVQYFNSVNVTTSGVAVFASQWPLSGPTNVTLSPAVGSDAAPLINAGEIFEVLSLGNRTLTRDVIALENVKSSLKNPPVDWEGDPCQPAGYPWTGITCSTGNRIRIIAINLKNMSLSGSLSPAIAKLTALNTIVLGNNKLYGRIPLGLGALNYLQKLDLTDNRFSGTIPKSLGGISSLRELHLERNYLSGTIPRSLIRKPGLNFTFTPGNHLSLATPTTS